MNRNLRMFIQIFFKGIWKGNNLGIEEVPEAGWRSQREPRTSASDALKTHGHGGIGIMVPVDVSRPNGNPCSLLNWRPPIREPSQVFSRGRGMETWSANVDVRIIANAKRLSRAEG